MQEELLKLRSQLSAALNMIDTILVQNPRESTSAADTSSYRVSPGGPLSEDGVAELYMRLERGETDSIIARDMGISVQGVAKRRKIWKDSK